MFVTATVTFFETPARRGDIVVMGDELAMVNVCVEGWDAVLALPFGLC